MTYEAQKLAETICCEVYREVESAILHHGPMNSAHEGYAVMLEEMDELWQEIKLKNPDRVNLRKEAIQVAAMAVRFVLNVLEGGR